MKNTTILLLLTGILHATVYAAPPTGTFPPDSVPVAGSQPHAATALPQRWIYTPQVEPVLPADDSWWNSFGDPVLSRLIAMGQKNNFNISAALHRISMNRQLWKEAQAAYYPQLSISAGWTAMQQSARTSALYRETSATDYLSAGVDMSWEIDVFGRVKAARKLRKADVNVSRADYAGVQLSVAADIANAYFSLRMYQARLATAAEQDSSQSHILKITRTRKDVGLASGLDVAQAEQVLASTRSSIPQLEAMVRTSLNSLALLAGVYPDEISYVAAQDSAGLPAPEHLVKAGTPADLIRRRPDIAAAEYSLATYAAQIGIAKKDFLPTLTLNGSIGTAAHSPAKLFSSHSFDWQVAPAISWTIFDGNARNYRVQAATEQWLAQIDSYNLTVMTAVQEVDNAMVSYAASLRTLALFRNLEKQTDRTLQLSVDLYKQGLSDFSNVMNAQISVLNARNSVISAHADALMKLVALYRALGGGWDAPE